MLCTMGSTAGTAFEPISFSRREQPGNTSSSHLGAQEFAPERARRRWSPFLPELRQQQQPHLLQHADKHAEHAELVYQPRDAVLMPYDATMRVATAHISPFSEVSTVECMTEAVGEETARQLQISILRGGQTRQVAGHAASRPVLRAIPEVGQAPEFPSMLASPPGLFVPRDLPTDTQSFPAAYSTHKYPDTIVLDALSHDVQSAPVPDAADTAAAAAAAAVAPGHHPLYPPKPTSTHEAPQNCGAYAHSNPAAQASAAATHQHPVCLPKLAATPEAPLQGEYAPRENVPGDAAVVQVRAGGYHWSERQGAVGEAGRAVPEDMKWQKTWPGTIWDYTPITCFSLLLLGSALALVLLLAGVLW